MKDIMQPTRLTFVHSPNQYYSELQNNGVIFMPVWAYTLASHIEDDGRYDLALVDTRINKIEDVEKSEIFLFSGINQDLPDILESQSILSSKFPTAKFVIGGPICWSFDQAGDLGNLDAFDHIVIGDGEAVINSLIADIVAEKLTEKIIRNAERFNFGDSRPFYRHLLDNSIDRYYGAVLEVSRGCPFLCEFCDIRILQDNNRAHNRQPEIIVKEINHLCSLGVNSFLLACDNFIGDPRWAEEVVDKILEWQSKSAYRPVFYTWLTINLYKMPRLMSKMRAVGFDNLFIGVESFNSNSLLETAKVQNTASGVVGAIREIQSYGFPVVAGLIFGFDSDDSNCFETTLNGLLEAGLMSGDPSLLTALPGTPLFRRMTMANRIRDSKYGLGGHKYHTNIKYLLPKEFLINGYLDFAIKLSSGSYQFERFKAFMDNLDRDNYIPLGGRSYFNLKLAIRVIRNNPKALKLTLFRLGAFVSAPSNIWYLLRAFKYAFDKNHIEGRFGYLQFWFAIWTTIIVKYRGITENDFDIESFEGQLETKHIIPKGYEELGEEAIQSNKTLAQRRETLKSLEMLVKRKIA